MASVARIGTGSRGLDALLGGGIRFGAVTLVYGEPASGKSTLALSVVACCLRADRGARARFVDSDAKFSLPRLTEITGPDAPFILNRFEYSKPSDFEAQAGAVEELLSSARRGDIVVVDSVTGLYRVETGDAARTWAENKELNRQLGYLKEMALTRGAALLLTGQVHSVVDSPVPQVEPVAQRLLRFWSDVILRIEPTPTWGVRRVTLEKPEAARGAFRVSIGPTGLSDAEEAA